MSFNQIKKTFIWTSIRDLINEFSKFGIPIWNQDNGSKCDCIAGDEIVHFSYSSQWPFRNASNDIDDNNSLVQIREIKENSVQKPTLNRYSLNKCLYNSV